jgi:O-antigen/teichoic acid export membrane protein
VPIGLASSIGVLNSEIDKLFVSIAYDTELTAIYTNAAREIPVSIIIASITAVVVPELVKLLSNNQQVKAINLWKASMAIGMYIMFFFGALFFVFSEEIMVFLYSDKYISGSNLFRIYSLNMIIRFTYFGAILSSLGKSKYILFSSLATLVLNIILNFVLHYFLGVNGLAIATLCSLALVALFQLGITSKIMKIKFKQIFPINYFIKIAIINILFALLFWFVKVKTQELLNDILLLLITSCIWFLLYGFIIKKSIKKLWYKIN